MKEEMFEDQGDRVVFDRKIVITDNITLTVKVGQDATLAEVGAEAMLINKIVKAIESIDMATAFTKSIHKAHNTAKKARTKKTAEELAQIVKRFNAGERQELLADTNTPNIDALYCKIYYYKNRPDVKAALKGKPEKDNTITYSEKLDIVRRYDKGERATLMREYGFHNENALKCRVHYYKKKGIGGK